MPTTYRAKVTFEVEYTLDDDEYLKRELSALRATGKPSPEQKIMRYNLARALMNATRFPARILLAEHGGLVHPCRPGSCPEAITITSPGAIRDFERIA